MAARGPRLRLTSSMSGWDHRSTCADWLLRRMTRNGFRSAPPNFSSPARMRAIVAGLSGFFRLKMLLPLTLQSMTSRAARQRFVFRTASAAGLRVRRRRPGDLMPAAARHDEQPLPCRRVAVVGGVEDAILDLVAERLERLEERPVRLALLALQRLAVRADRAPRAELRHVLDQDRVDVELLRPFQDVPGARARLRVDRAAAARRREVRAFRTGEQQMQPAARNGSRRDRRARLIRRGA
jgi:hypothetical protein